MRYLIRKDGLKVKAHIWNGINTECNMMIDEQPVPDNFSIYPNCQSKKICQNCLNKQLQKIRKRKDYNTTKKITGSVANLRNSIKVKIKPKNDRNKVKKLKKYKKIKDNFYRSKEWREIRYKALKLCGRKCLCCGAKPPEIVLHVDHIKPRSKYPELALEITNLQVLCEDCNLGKSNTDCIDYRPH